MAKLDLKKYQTKNADQPIAQTLEMPDGTKGDVWIKPMSASDAAAFKTALFGGSVAHLSDALAWQVAKSLVDENGEQQLTVDEVQSLEHDVFLQIANTIHMVNNPEPEAKKK